MQFRRVDLISTLAQRYLVLLTVIGFLGWTSAFEATHNTLAHWSATALEH
ncbi:hypothetical protein PF004_g32103 [Phytophthora fragariae]|uniref:Uncharacterized protein n=1 Tax=Phytophthora fragariae TaxID=53985 RepID=A0A6G0M7J0_9STRA|nr:hypothetical protein PF004_g32103 [Phytophthora fragariae]